MTRHLALVAALVGAVLLAGVARAAPGLSAKPDIFIGHDGDCGANSLKGIADLEAAWIPGEGIAGPTDAAIHLQKTGATTDCSAAGVVIDGSTGMHLTQLGYDIRSDGHCGATSPRFFVKASDGMHSFSGCAMAPGSEIITDSAGRTWRRVRIDVNNPLHAFPPLAPGQTVQSITLSFDEGTDAGPDYTGEAYVDNISINDTLIGGPGAN